MARDVSNSEDVLDSRDVIGRIEELQDIEERDESEEEELVALLALQFEAEDSPDWQYGETLIRDTYFRDYAQELAEDIGAISGNETWPLSYIDWDAATQALQQDYFEVDFDGVTYWIRN